MFFTKKERQNKEYTICSECKHCINTASLNAGVWYSFYCGAIVNKKQINFVTGELEYEQKQKHPHCDYINRNGDCQLFEFCYRKDLQERIGTSGKL